MKIFNKILLLLVLFLNFFYCNQGKKNKLKIPNVFKGGKPLKSSIKNKKKDKKKKKEQECFSKLNNLIYSDTLDFDEDSNEKLTNNASFKNLMTSDESIDYGSNESHDHNGNKKNLFIKLEFSNFTLIKFDDFKNDFFYKINKNDLKKHYDNYVNCKINLLKLNDKEVTNSFYKELKEELIDSNKNESENFQFLNFNFINFINDFILKCNFFKEITDENNKENIKEKEKEEKLNNLNLTLKKINKFNINENNLKFFKNHFQSFLDLYKKNLKRKHFKI